MKFKKEAIASFFVDAKHMVKYIDKHMVYGRINVEFRSI